MEFPFWSIPLVAINVLFLVLLASMQFSKDRGNERLPTRFKWDGALLFTSYLLSTLMTPFILVGSDATPAGKEFLYFIGSVIFTSFIALLLVLVMRNHYICKRNKEEKANRNYTDFIEKLSCEEGSSARRDNSRKILHLIIPFSALAVYLVTYPLDLVNIALDNFQFLGVHYISISRGINLIIFWAFGFMITLQDIYRLRAFHCIPGWGRRWLAKSLVPREHYTYVSSSAFLIGHVPFLVAPLPVFFTMSFIASLADATSSFVGMRVGKHRVPWLSSKSFEGTAGGGAVAFATSFTVNLFLGSHASIWTPVLLAAVMAVAYCLLDLFNERLNDNFINTTVIGAIAWLAFLIA